MLSGCESQTASSPLTSIGIVSSFFSHSSSSASSPLFSSSFSSLSSGVQTHYSKVVLAAARATLRRVSATMPAPRLSRYRVTTLSKRFCQNAISAPKDPTKRLASTAKCLCRPLGMNKSSRTTSSFGPKTEVISAPVAPEPVPTCSGLPPPRLIPTAAILTVAWQALVSKTPGNISRNTGVLPTGFASLWQKVAAHRME